MPAFRFSWSSSRSDPISARRVHVDWPREAEEKSDQNEKLSERSEFFSFRFFLSIAGSGQSSGSPSFGYFSWRSKKSDTPSGEIGAWHTETICASSGLRTGSQAAPRMTPRWASPLTLALSREGRGDNAALRSVYGSKSDAPVISEGVPTPIIAKSVGAISRNAPPSRTRTTSDPTYTSGTLSVVCWVCA